MRLRVALTLLALLAGLAGSRGATCPTLSDFWANNAAELSWLTPLLPANVLANGGTLLVPFTAGNVSGADLPPNFALNLVLPTVNLEAGEVDAAGEIQVTSAANTTVRVTSDADTGLLSAEFAGLGGATASVIPVGFPMEKGVVYLIEFDSTSAPGAQLGEVGSGSCPLNGRRCNYNDASTCSGASGCGNCACEFDGETLSGPYCTC